MKDLIIKPVWIGVLLALVLFGCKDASIEPVLFGDISGTVRHAESKEPIEGAQVTTSPPSGSVVTDASGSFRMDHVEAGNYTITVTKPDFSSKSTTVTVSENRTTQAAILLQREAMGSIEGTVLDSGTQQPLAGVSVSTMPPSSAVVTNAEGMFSFDDIETGDYVLMLSKAGYQKDSVAVTVKKNTAAKATVFLEKVPETSKGALSVEIRNWGHRAVTNDSVFVWVDYRVSNTGGAPIEEYEVYFRIDAGEEQFTWEEEGESLAVTQADNRTFERYIFGQTATSVAVEDTWFK